MPHAATFLRLSKMCLPETWRVEFRLWPSDMTQRPQLEFDHRLFAEPIGPNQRSQHPERADARLAGMHKR